LTPETIAKRLYRSERIFERHRHRYEFVQNYLNDFEKRGVVFSGKSLDGRRMEVMEIPKQFFHFATQFHGEFKSRPGRPSPPYYGFVKSSLDRKMGKPRPEF
jgi:CTP synthase